MSILTPFDSLTFQERYNYAIQQQIYNVEDAARHYNLQCEQEHLKLLKLLDMPITAPSKESSQKFFNAGIKLGYKMCEEYFKNLRKKQNANRKQTGI